MLCIRLRNTVTHTTFTPPLCWRFRGNIKSAFTVSVCSLQLPHISNKMQPVKFIYSTWFYFLASLTKMKYPILVVGVSLVSHTTFPYDRCFTSKYISALCVSWILKKSCIRPTPAKEIFEHADYKTYDLKIILSFIFTFFPFDKGGYIADNWKVNCEKYAGIIHLLLLDSFPVCDRTSLFSIYF
jgi:hypothetical protein